MVWVQILSLTNDDVPVLTLIRRRNKIRIKLQSCSFAAFLLRWDFFFHVFFQIGPPSNHGGGQTIFYCKLESRALDPFSGDIS